MPRGPRRSAPATLNDPTVFTDKYYVPKRSGTSADVLTAYGLAALLYEVLRQAEGSGFQINILDAGSHYSVQASEPLSLAYVERCHYFSLVPLIATKRTHLTGVPASEVRSFNEAWEHIQAARGAPVSKPDTSSDTLAEAGADQGELACIDPDHWVTVFVGTRQMQAHSAYNKVAKIWWDTRKALPWNLKACLAIFGLPGGNWPTVRSAWKAASGFPNSPDVTCCQLLNPHQGKGQNRQKANALKMDNVSCFWLIEYLKCSGLWECATPRRIRGGRDWKTYVLAPVELSLEAHREVFRKFAKCFSTQTSVKMDCLASLRYASLLLRHTEPAQSDKLASLFRQRPLRQIVAGFHTAEYRLLNPNAYTMINLGFMGLPHWIGPLNTNEQVHDVESVLEEHEGVLREIPEARSEGAAMLSAYRSFLSAGTWPDFFRFTDAFASHLMRELDEARQKNRVPRQRALTVRGLEVMFQMSDDTNFQEITKKPGFRAMARAIRRSTVSLQYMLRNRPRSALPYEIRYGLARELLTKSHRTEEFLQALSAFAASYNGENARVAEKKANVWRRELITDRDLDDVVELVDKFGAATVAHLLVAYGYAREPREENCSEGIT